MKIRLKKIFVVFLFSNFLIFNIHQSYAAAIPGLSLVVETMAGAATVVPPRSPVTAVLAVGLGLAYLTFQNSNGKAVRVPAGTSAGNVVPAPVLPASTPASFQYYVYYNQVGAWGSSGMEACSNWAAIYAGQANPPQALSYTNGYCNMNMYNSATGTWGVTAMGEWSGYTCPGGYTVSGTNCVLSTPRQNPDNKVDYQRSGTTFSKITGDIDTETVSQLKTTTNTNDTVLYAGVDSSGNPYQVSVQGVTTGSIINTQYQTTDALGQTYEQTQTVTTDLNGVIQSAVQTATAKALSYNAATQSYSEVATNGTPSTSAAPQNITFPSDYARTGEAAAAASAVTASIDAQSAKLDTLHHDLSDPGTPSADPYVPVSTDLNASFFPASFDSLKGWRLPAHSSTCPTAIFDLSALLGRVYVMDAQCSLMENNRSALSVTMVVVFTIAALFIVLRA